VNPTGCDSHPLNRRGKAMIITAGIGLLVPVALRISGKTPALLWEGIAFAFGCVFLWLSLRYLFIRYRYEIDRVTDGRWYLFVGCLKGRRKVEQAQLPLDDLRSVRLLSEKEAAALDIPPKNTPLQRYHAQLFPERLLYLTFESEGETIVLALDADESFAGALSAYLERGE